MTAAEYAVIVFNAPKNLRGKIDFFEVPTLRATFCTGLR